MIKNFAITAWRNIIRHKVQSLINILGLAAGLTCCILILLLVQEDLSFDRFHRNADRICRLNKIVTPQSGGTELHSITSGLMGPTMVRDFPEVERSTRVLPWFDEVLMTYGETSGKVADVLFTDSTFFSTFDFVLLRGNPRDVLARPMSIVLTERTARKFFGDMDPIGQSIIGFQDKTYTVTGVAAESPSNSHFTFNALISWSSTVAGVGPIEMTWMNNWLAQIAYTYLLLTPETDPGALQLKFGDFMLRHFERKADQYELYLQPLTEIYLKSGNILFTRGLRIGSEQSVYVVSGIAVLILLIACINFMNLATARADRRSKEVGVRKVFGADRRSIAYQFLGESTFFAMMAMGLSLVAAYTLLPAFNALTARDLRLELAENGLLLSALVALTLFVGLISGAYPALVLSGFQPARVLKGIWNGAARSVLPRKILVTAQFTAAVALISGTIVIYEQMEFARLKDPGFKREQVIVLPIGNTEIPKNFEAFKSQLLGHPGILAATGCNSVPGEGTMSFGVRPEGKPETEDWTFSSIRVDDYDLLATYDMQMSSGRYFSKDFPTDATHGVVINESLARSLGWDEPLGKRFHVEGEVADGRVIGVIRDFHMKSFHYPIEPIFIYVAPRYGNLSVRISPEDFPGTIEFMRKTWASFDPRYPFEYYFLDDRLDMLYASDQRLMQTLGLFSLLAILVSGLGLFGLTSFVAEQRTKEIGIRKVLGARVAGIVMLLSVDFLKLIVVATIIASPIAWLAMRRWLQDFAYRIDLSWGVFALAGGIALAIAFLTMSTQAISAASGNPVESMRYE